MSTKAIIFDFFGVLSSPVHTSWLKKHSLEDAEAQMQKEFMHPTDLGEITETELFAGISKLDSQTPEAVREEWLGLALINTELVAFITELHTHHKIALCSNAPTPFLREILQKNNLESLFDVIVISSEVRLAKPDPAIYELTLERLGVTPEEAIFTDDSTNNVAAAEALGITGFVFTTTEQLQSDFKTSGLV